MDLSPVTKVILGMLSLGPQTGYDIKVKVDRSTRFFWAASYGSIYTSLRGLEGKGLVECREMPHGERRRNVYSLTEAGEATLREWLRGTGGLLELRNEALLKLLFAGELSAEGALDRLHDLRDQHAALAETLRCIEPEGEEDRPFPRLVLQFGIELNEWIVEWCQRVEVEVFTGRPATGRAREAGPRA